MEPRAWEFTNATPTRQQILTGFARIATASTPIDRSARLWQSRYALKKKVARLAPRILVICWILSAVCSYGVTRSWIGAVSSDWSNAKNWNPNGVPSLSDVVQVNTPGTVILTNDAVVSALTLINGTLNGGGALTIVEAMNWQGGTIRLRVNITSTAQLAIAGNAEKSLTGGLIVNEGTTVWTNAGRLFGNAGAEFRNVGIFEAHNDSAVTFCCSYPVAIFRNLHGGAFRKTDSTGLTSFNEWVFDNAGRIEIDSGALALSGQTHSLRDGSEIAGNGLVQVLSPLQLEGTIAVQTNSTVEFTASSDLRGTASFAGPGNFVWSGGTNSAEVTIQPEATLSINGAASKTVDRGVLNNRGKILWTDPGDIIVTAGAQIDNSGSFHVKNNARVVACCGNPQPVIHNESTGLLRKSNSSGETTLVGISWLNEGKLQVYTGQIRLPSGEIIVGVCPISPPSSLTVESLPSGADLRLAWNAPVVPADAGVTLLRLAIEQQTDGGAFFLATNLPPASTAVVFPLPATGTTNSFRVAAVTDLCNSDYSNIARLVTVRDSDGDGLPDNFEIAYGLDPQSPADANIDSDSDGQTNLEEFRSGTNPRDPSSVFRITGIDRMGGGIRITFNSVSGKSYRVEATERLLSPAWTTVQDFATATGNVLTITDATAATQRFYRIVLQP